MNKVILIGRLTRDPEIRWSQGQDQSCIARYTLAVDRKYRKDDGSQNADFISCTVFGRQAEFAEKYLKQGTKIAITGRIQTGSYTNREGQKVYTTDVIIEEQEFAESKASSGSSEATGTGNSTPTNTKPVITEVDGFMHIPDGLDEEIPFN